MKATKRRFLAATLALSTTFMVGVTAAQTEYPTRPITMVLPFPAGGITDVLSRMVASEMSASMGQPIIVENKPGGGGQIAAAQVLRNPADGYTLFVAATEMFVINPTLFTKFSYSPLKDFAPVSPLAASPLVLVVPQQSPANSVEELVALSKSKTDGVSFASQGVGSIGHLLGAQFANQTQANLSHVPYKGSAPGLQDVMGNHVDMMFDPVITTAPLIEAKKLKPLAIAAKERSQALPDVKTLAELGVPDVDAGVWFGMVVKTGTPDAIVQRLNTELAKALKSPEVAKRLQDQGMQALQMSPSQFGEFLQAEEARWVPLVKATGATVQ